MNKYQLEVLLTVAQTKKISTAAKLLHLTQPAVSSQIKALENHYKTSLFDRNKQGVELTPAGEIVCKHAKKILASFEATEREIDQLLNVENQSLIIGATQTVGNYAVPCSIWTFREKYPKAKISLEIDNLQTIMTKLEDQLIDIAVVEGLSEENITSNYVMKNSSSDEIIIIYPGNDKWDESFAAKKSLPDLTNYPLILPTAGLGLLETFTKEVEKQGLTIDQFDVVSELGSIEAVKSSVQAGLGFSICSRMAVQKELRQDAIRELTIGEMSMPLNFDIVYKKNHFLSVLAHRFIQFIGKPEELALCE